jgi:Flp pilus assembly protein TadD
MSRARALFRLVALCCVVIVSSQLVSAQAQSVSSSSYDALLERVERAWWKWKALARQEQANSERQQAASDLLTLLQEEQVGRLEDYADAAMLEGRRQAASGNYASAREAFELAAKLDPQHRAAAWNAGQASRQAGDSALRAVAGFWNSIGSIWRGYWTRYSASLELLLWFAIGAWVAGAAIVLTLFLRHAPRLVHEVDERLPSRWHEAWRRVVAWGLVLSPLAVGFLGAWAVMIWAVILIPAYSTAERRVVYAWLLAIAVAVPAINALWVAASAAVSPAARAAVASAERSLQPDLVAELTALSEARPNEATWKVLLARLLAVHEPEQAAHLLREAATREPRDPRIRIMLGNLMFRVGKHEAAGVQYREALDLDANNALAMFNLSRVKLTANEFTVAEELLHNAGGADADLIARVEKSVPQHDVADPEFRARDVARQVLAEQAIPGLRRALRFVNFLSLTAILALCGAAVLHLRVGSFAAVRCSRCGRARCSRCPGEGQQLHDALCSACEGLFARREGISPEAKREQANRVDRYLKRVSRTRALVQLIWPGLAMVHDGRTIAGSICALIWAVLIAACVWPTPLLSTGSLFGIWEPGRPALILAIGFWLLMQMVSWRSRDQALPGLAR